MPAIQPKGLTANMMKRRDKAIMIFSTKGLDPAVAYLQAAFDDLQNINRLLAQSEPPFRDAVVKAIGLVTDRAAKKVEKNKAAAEAAAVEASKRASKENGRLEEIAKELVCCSSQAKRVRYLSSLPPDDRKRFATRLEEKECIALRKQCVTTAKALAHLSATKTEFERWVGLGFIEPLFTRRIHVGQMVTARFWSLQELDDLAESITLLRSTWEITKNVARASRRVPTS